MIGRRGILGMLLGAPAMLPGLSVAARSTPSMKPYRSSPYAADEEEAVQAAWDRFYYAQNAEDRMLRGVPMPEHIASKRSWSPAFKAGEAKRLWDEHDQKFRLRRGRDPFSLLKRLGIVD